MKNISNEDLLNLLIGALALRRLHSEKGGSRISLAHAEDKIVEYKAEILRRME